MTCLPSDHNPSHRPDSAIEFLARESHASIADVARLYGNELAELERNARVTAFIPVLAFRKVRALLRRRAGVPIASP